MRGHLGSDWHSFPRAIAAFCCTAVLLASPAAWRSSSNTISVPSRLLAVPSSWRQWAKHRAAFPDTISSQLELSKWRKTDSSVKDDKGIADKKHNTQWNGKHENQPYTALKHMNMKTTTYCTNKHTKHTHTLHLHIRSTLKFYSWTNRVASKGYANVPVISHFYQTSPAPPVPSDWQQCTLPES